MVGSSNTACLLGGQSHTGQQQFALYRQSRLTLGYRSSVDILVFGF